MTQTLRVVLAQVDADARSNVSDLDPRPSATSKKQKAKRGTTNPRTQSPLEEEVRRQLRWCEKEFGQRNV